MQAATSVPEGASIIEFQMIDKKQRHQNLRLLFLEPFYNPANTMFHISQIDAAVVKRVCGVIGPLETANAKNYGINIYRFSTVFQQVFLGPVVFFMPVSCRVCSPLPM